MEHIRNKSPQEKITVIIFVIVMMFLIAIVKTMEKTI
jgi:hypothetical protein